jgi:hypothetical protein
MPRRSKFTFTFAPEALDHLDFIERKYHRLIERTIDDQLSYTPDTETRNRKILDQPAPYEAIGNCDSGRKTAFECFTKLIMRTRRSGYWQSELR